MQIGTNGFFHLTYCTKIHPSHGWDELFACIQTYVPALKARLARAGPFGLGLRLSAAETLELLAHDNLAQFQEFLSRNDVYVFTLNGFPYGPFRGPSVKAAVFSPDWRDEARVAYTERLIEILATLLPPGLEGSISTLPLSYKPWLAPGDIEALQQITANLAHIVWALIRVREEQGMFIRVDLEPEPDGLLENSADVVDFFQQWLLPHGARLLADWTGTSLTEARGLLLEHLQICLDTCHLAVAYEDLAAVLERFQANGIRVGKVQITSGLKVSIPETQEQRRALARQLEPFSRSPYLHQVIAQSDGGAHRHYRDLAATLPQFSTVTDRQWRIHFHMPLYVAGYEGLLTTQEETSEMLRVLKERNFCRHLELETYTWEVLPAALQMDILDSLEREYRWTLQVLNQEI
ncbi:MAG: metabolite traffic protein EboE [Syntrophobacterales bacterium]